MKRGQKSKMINKILFLIDGRKNPQTKEEMWMMIFPILIVWLFHSNLTFSLSPNGTEVIKIGLIYGFTDEDPTLLDAINAVFLEAIELNSQPDLIHPNAKIEIVYRNSQLDERHLVAGVYDFVKEEDSNVIGLIGAGYSRLSRTTSIMTQSFNIPMCCGSSTVRPTIDVHIIILIICSLLF